MQMSPNTWIIIAIIALIVIIIIALLVAGIIMHRSPKLQVVAQPTRVVQFQQPTAQMIPTNTVQFQPTTRVPQYVELRAQDHPGDDLLYRPDLADNIPALENLCNNTPGCVAFNNAGYLKNVAQPTFPSAYNLYYLQ